MRWDELLQFYSVVVLERADYATAIRFIWHSLGVRSKQDLDKVFGETDRIMQSGLPEEVLKQWLQICECAASLNSLDSDHVAAALADRVSVVDLRYLVANYFKFRIV